MKHIFFDIDGTIWDYSNVIPKSTSSAIRKLQANGHKAYICTGRTRGYITDPKLLELGFDGIVSGLGTRVETDGKTLFEYIIPGNDACKTVDTVKRYGFKAILEGPEYLYLDYNEFKDDPYGVKVMSELNDRLRPLSGEYGNWRISKLSCDTTGCDKASCYSELSGIYDFVEHNETVVEMVPKGFSKGTGIRKLCDLKGIDIRDTIAFGDGVNDIEMFMAAGFSVAMGNGAEAAKANADYVTTGVREDGLQNALSHLGLI